MPITVLSVNDWLAQNSSERSRGYRFDQYRDYLQVIDFTNHSNYLEGFNQQVVDYERANHTQIPYTRPPSLNPPNNPETTVAGNNPPPPPLPENNPPPPPPPTTTTPMATASTPTVKLGKPEKFTGKPEQVRHHLAHCNLYFMVNARLTEVQKIIYSLSFMAEAGITGEWVTSTHNILEMDLNLAAANKVMETWVKYITAFKSQFEQGDIEQKARDEIYNLKQGRASADSYASRFLDVLSRTGINEELIKIELFKRGLDWSLLLVCLNMKTLSTNLAG